jgi:glycopeptide antibiotics resistance protein
VPLVVIGGASIELVQAAISTLIGVRYRWLDIDDAILNGVGLALGWLVVAVALRGRTRWRQRPS